MGGRWVKRGEMHGDLADMVGGERRGLTLEDHRLAVYLAEITNQAQAFIIATETLQHATDSSDNDRMFAAMQSMLTAAASVSRMFHPPRAKPLHKQRAALLVSALPTTASDAALKSREVRNAFEHFEEHLDEYLNGAAGNMVMDRMVTDMPIEDAIRLGDGPLPKALRAYRLDTQTITVLDWSIDLGALLKSVMSAANEAHRVMGHRLGKTSGWRPPTGPAGQDTA